MEGSLAGKVAVITGGAQGVGLGVAQEFIAQGARVVITGLDQAQLDKVVQELGPQSYARGDALNGRLGWPHDAGPYDNNMRSCSSHRFK